MTGSGRAPAGQALVQAPSPAVSAASGFDPSRIPYSPLNPEVGQVWRSEEYAMCCEYSRDERGDPTVEFWRFANEDDGVEGYGWLEVRVHDIVGTDRSGTLAVYYRQWFAPDGEPAWGKRPQRKIGAIGSLKSLIRRRKMTLTAAPNMRPADLARGVSQ